MLGWTLQAPVAFPRASPSRTLLPCGGRPGPPRGSGGSLHPAVDRPVPSGVWCQDETPGKGGVRLSEWGQGGDPGQQGPVGRARPGLCLRGGDGQGLTGAVFARLPGWLHPCSLLMAAGLLPGTHKEQRSHAPQSCPGPPELAWHVGLLPSVPQMAPSTPAAQDSFPSRSRGRTS